MPDYEPGDVIYENALARPSDVASWRIEGDAAVGFPRSRMRMEALRSLDDDEACPHFVHWCPAQLPDNIAISWDFWPIHEPGLAILFFAAAGRDGGSVLDPSLAPRTGPYDQYHHGDINALHVSYFRRVWDTERRFHTCNLRKSYGFHMVAQGADPIPDVADADGPYRVCVVKAGSVVAFSIDELEIFRWVDDGESFGRVLGGGQIGFRQMSPLIAEYANLKVRAVMT